MCIRDSFGIQPPPPVCDRLDVNSPIFLGQPSSLRAVNCRVGGGTGTLLNYEWFISPESGAPTDFGRVDNPNSSTSIYHAPLPGTTFSSFKVDLSVWVCNPGATTANRVVDATTLTANVCGSLGCKSYDIDRTSTTGRFNNSPTSSDFFLPSGPT